MIKGLEKARSNWKTMKSLGSVFTCKWHYTSKSLTFNEPSSWRHFSFLLFWDIILLVFWEYFIHSVCALFVSVSERDVIYSLSLSLSSLFMCKYYLFWLSNSTRNLLGPGSDQNRCGANPWKRLTIFTRKKDRLFGLQKKASTVSPNDLFRNIETFLFET